MLVLSTRRNAVLLRMLVFALMLAVLLLSVVAVAHFHPDQSHQNNDHCPICNQVAGFVVVCAIYL